jgi:hypothetical protein
VKALQLTLGLNMHGYETAYVDYIIVHSSNFELHLKHLDDVLGKLTRQVFTVNADKCYFCKTEISFWGHVIKQGFVSPDSRKLEAVLNYSAQRNQRDLL